MQALDTIDGRPAVETVLTLVTPAALRLMDDEPALAAATTAQLMVVRSDDQARTANRCWRPSYPLDDESLAPDMWVGLGTCDGLWIRRDDHLPYEPEDGRCGWCGKPHEGVLAIFTVMTPADY